MVSTFWYNQTKLEGPLQTNANGEGDEGDNGNGAGDGNGDLTNPEARQQTMAVRMWSPIVHEYRRCIGPASRLHNILLV